MTTDRSTAVRDVAAFCALLSDSPLDPPSCTRLRESELQRLAARALYACTTTDVNASRGDVLMTALKLLEQSLTSVNDDVLVLLLRLVAALQKQMSWGASVNARAHTVLTALVGELESSTRESTAAVAAIAREITAQLPDAASHEPHTRASSPPPTTGSLDELGVSLPLEAKYLELCIDRLRNGTRSQRVLTLDQLRALPHSVAEQLVCTHNGAALLAPLVSQDADQEVLQAARLLVQRIVQRCVTCYGTMLEWWLARQEEREDREDASEQPPQPFAADSDAFVQALGVGWGQFPGERALNDIRLHANRLNIALLLNLRAESATLAYLIKYHSLVQVVATALRRLHFTMAHVSDDAATIAHIRETSERLWNFLLEIAQSWTPRDHERPRVVAETHIVGELAIEVLETEPSTIVMRAAMKTLLTLLKSANALQREAIASFVDVAHFVRLLAAQSHESVFGIDLIAVLRTIAATPHLAFARAIEQTVASLALADDALAAPYAHNLLLITRDVPGVYLGASSGIDRAISVRAVVDVLVTTTSETERVVALRSLYHDLALDTMDPLCFVEATPVTRMIAERLSSVIAVAFDGSADVERLSRPIVTAVARSDDASLALVAKYVLVKPTLVLPELRELALAQTERTTMCGDASDAEYDYSDDDEMEDSDHALSASEDMDPHDESDWEVVDAM